MSSETSNSQCLQYSQKGNIEVVIVPPFARVPHYFSKVLRLQRFVSYE